MEKTEEIHLQDGGISQSVLPACADGALAVRTACRD